MTAFVEVCVKTNTELAVETDSISNQYEMEASFLCACAKHAAKVLRGCTGSKFKLPRRHNGMTY